MFLLLSEGLKYKFIFLGIAGWEKGKIKNKSKNWKSNY